MARLDEFGLIRLLTGGRTGFGSGVVVGIGDDAAVVEPPAPGRQLVLACDAMVEGVHFAPETMRDEDVGYKALASNVSDMAAMGAVPRYALISLSAPRGCGEDRLRRLYDGLYACAGTYGVAVVGGDTTASPGGLVVAVTLVGEVEAGAALLRSGARPGDDVFVTGPAGLSAAGLHLLLAAGRRADEPCALAAHHERLALAHRRPAPHVAAGRLLLASGGCGALNDVSDGIASEAWEIAEASGCGVLLDARALPVHPALAQYAAETGMDPLDWMLYGGEDYVLLGTVRRDAADAAASAFAREGLAFTPVGQATDAFAGVRLVRRDGREEELAKKGYNHFSE